MAQPGFRQRWQKLKFRYGAQRINAVAIILLIGLASLSVRLLLHFQLDKSALLYVAVPYLIALGIVLIRPDHSSEKWWHGYRDHALSALIVFFASSIVLFEGFICVLYFLPIYFLGITIAFLINYQFRKKNNGRTLVSVLPLLILASSFEGTSEQLSLERENHVVVSKVVELSADQIMENIATPFNLQKERNWLISVFPMPYKIEAGTLAPGDVHRVHTRYRRWFVTNTQQGEMLLQIVDVTPTTVTTKVLADSTFFSSYLETMGTQISLKSIAPGQTEIQLRIDYRRKLDPAWYFHPLQKQAVSQMARFLIDEVMIREQ